MQLRGSVKRGQRLFHFMEEEPILFGVLSLLAGIALSVYYFGHVYPIKSAIWGSEGQETTGTIARMYTAEASEDRSDIKYYAEVSFQDANGQSHLIRDTYSSTQWYFLKNDPNAVVRYLKQNPSLAFETHSKEGVPPNVFWYLLLCGPFLLLGVVLIAYGRSLSHEEAEAQRASPPPYTASRRPPPGRPLG